MKKLFSLFIICIFLLIGPHVVHAANNPFVNCNIESGSYLEPQTVELTGNIDGNIYYTLDGSDPNENSIKYTDKILINNSCTLKYIIIGKDGSKSETFIKNYDVTQNNLDQFFTMSPKGGYYKESQTVTFNLTQGDIYYTLDGTDPNKSGIKYKNPILIDEACYLKYVYVSSEGKKSSIHMEQFIFPIIDSINNINLELNQEATFKFPQKVLALMTDDSKRYFNIKWNSTKLCTSIPGSYKFYGIVNGYNNKVILTVKVKKFIPVKSIKNGNRTQSSVQVKLYNYLMNYQNRNSVLKTAIKLHGGDPSNNCAYFSSESLRRVGIKVPTKVCNTDKRSNKYADQSLVLFLKSQRWKRNNDLSKLLPGDICFTTPEGGGKGRPTHVYIFMGWVDEKSKRYAYICDNQFYEYPGIYHVRNISFPTLQKEALQFYMYK